MDLTPVLARGVRIVAEIHHSHGVKAAVSVVHLRERFPAWTDDFWQSALQQAKWYGEPTIETPVNAPVLPMAPRRARVLLARAVVPVCYSALRAWAEACGTEAVIDHYLDEACTEPGYLGHRLSVLLALRDAWPLYRDGPDRALFLDRLTEFVVACRFEASAAEAPAHAALWADALAAALRRPGFFGHHLIGLAWIGRSSALGAQQLGPALAWVVRASATVYADAEDKMSITPTGSVACTEAALDDALRLLLTCGVRNIHLLTLADAIAWLWGDADDSVRAQLLAVAAQFAGQG